MTLPNSYRGGPDARGRFGIYGGRFVAETLMPLILELEQAYEAAKADPAFQAELDAWLADYVGRPSPLYFAERLTAAARRRQGLLQARRAQPHRRAQDQQHDRPDPARAAHGQDAGSSPRPAPASTASRPRPWPRRFGLPCVVYMGARDIERQKPNVFRMRLLGAEVRSVTSGSATLKDAMNEALRDWVTNVERHLLHHRHASPARIPIPPWCATSSR